MSKLEHVPCDLCGAIDPAAYKTLQDHLYGNTGNFTLVKCGYCGLIYINPRPDRASIGVYYPDLDYHAFKPNTGLKATLLNRMRENEAQSLMVGLPPTPKVLEIGGGTGDLLAALKVRGAEAVLVEPNAAAAQVAHERYGLTVQVGMLDQVQLEDGQFDLVMMKYALEHVHDPLATLVKIRKLLKQGGRAVFWVPNDRSWDARLFGKFWRGYDSPRHLYIFTPDTMRRLADTAGFKVERINYSLVPNDWAGSAEFWLKGHGVPAGIAKWLGMANPLIMAAWLPFSTLAAAFRRAGRIRVMLSKP
jgi:SAM-dependent methyltransferase